MNLRNKQLRIAGLVAALLVIAVLAASCTEDQRKSFKHMKSGIIGLKRQVTLYSDNGDVIRQWQGRFKIEMAASVATFIDDDGREIKIAGTYVIEEVD